MKHTVNSKQRFRLKNKAKNLLSRGKFGIDEDNQLYYWLNKPNALHEKGIWADRIKFSGTWKFDPNYDLEYILDEDKGKARKKAFVFKGEIISIEKDSLVFSFKSYDEKGLLHLQILKLSGRWQADSYNQLSFIVTKKAQPDTLTFKGSWQVNKNQQITYTYEKTDLKTKSKAENTLTFDGFWQIGGKNRLSYILSSSTKSQFDFRVQFESPNLYPQEGVVKYRIGMGLKKGRAFKEKIILLYGAWKFSRKLGLVFQISYGAGKTKALEFGADVNLSRDNKIIFALKNKFGQPLSLNVIFSHKFLKELDAEAFLKLTRNINRASGVEAGVVVPF